MRVLYVANHKCGGNDDEGAISHAFEALGHQVIKVDESVGVYAVRMIGKVDLLLFHKWEDTSVLERFKGQCPRVFWYFDLVDHPDPTLAARCNQRKQWMKTILPHVELGFCTDGDWVDKHSTHSHKLRWLTQGADERIAYRLPNPVKFYKQDILFTGISKGGGTERERFVQDLKDRYGSRFVHITKGLHREKLREEISNSRIVICPDSPITDRYWSNRVYNAAGFGGFILHPYCFYLIQHYSSNREVAYYHQTNNRTDLYQAIDFYISKQSRCDEIAQAGYDRTLENHLYRHRVESMLKQICALGESNVGTT